MPSNIIKINNCDELEWYVGDNNMDELIDYLDKIGFREISKDSEIIEET